MIFRKLASLSAALIISIGMVTPLSAADVPDEQWVPSLAVGEDGTKFQGLLIQENAQIAKKFSFLDCSGSSPLPCYSLEDDFVKYYPELSPSFEAILPRCSNDNEKNCIAGISAISPEGKIQNGAYVRNFHASKKNYVLASPERNFPAGETPSLWKIPGVLNGSGTDEYLVRFTIRGTIMSSADKLCPSCTNFKGFSAIVSPISIKKGNYSNVVGWQDRNQDETRYCAALEDGACALNESFPNGYRFKLDVRLGASPTGWVHGRIKDPKVQLTRSGDVTLLSVEGEPVVVPVMGIIKPSALLSLKARSFYEDKFLQNRYQIDGKSIQISTPEPDGESSFYEYELWKDLIGDKASASPSQWTYRSLTIPFTSAECFKDTSKFIGVVTTNAMMYAGGPPVFNKVEGTLEYKVGSPHLTSKGEVFKGTYNLQLSSEAARCLYNFTSAPIKATISIINESGEKSVATTTVSEKDGWLRMAAYGFTFSNPTLKVKLTQDNNSNTATSGVKTSITCVKGKTSKKVTAVNPKCPTGYKKK